MRDVSCVIKLCLHPYYNGHPVMNNYNRYYRTSEQCKLWTKFVNECYSIYLIILLNHYRYIAVQLNIICKCYLLLFFCDYCTRRNSISAFLIKFSLREILQKSINHWIRIISQESRTSCSKINILFHHYYYILAGKSIIPF